MYPYLGRPNHAELYGTVWQLCRTSNGTGNDQQQSVRQVYPSREASTERYWTVIP